MTQEYETLEPVKLLAEMETLQDKLWQYSWKKNGPEEADYVVTKDDVIDHSVVLPRDPPSKAAFITLAKKLICGAPTDMAYEKGPV